MLWLVYNFCYNSHMCGIGFFFYILYGICHLISTAKKPPCASQICKLPALVSLEREWHKLTNAILNWQSLDDSPVVLVLLLSRIDEYLTYQKAVFMNIVFFFIFQSNWEGTYKDALRTIRSELMEVITFNSAMNNFFIYVLLKKTVNAM